MTQPTMEELYSLAKRRGFLYPSSQIYGGIKGFYDFGPMGVELKRNLIESWWSEMIYKRDDVYGLDAAQIMGTPVFKASGHLETFSDPMVDCRQCKARHRADHLETNKCPQCGSEDLTEPRPFNLMMKTSLGPVESDDSIAYLRPETAQGIFVNFKNIVDSFSPKLPFGIAQVGKAFRNEITPRNFIFRVREFEQMELEFFCEPGQDDKWHSHWVEKRVQWWEKQGLNREDIILFEQPKEELAHYAKKTVDILYKFPHGEEELEGVANRQDYDLGSHSKEQELLNLTAKVKQNDDSTAKLAVKDKDNNWLVPFVIEPSAGVERGVLACLTAAYCNEDLGDGKSRVVLKLPYHLSPVKVAVMPLAKNNPQIQSVAKDVVKSLKRKGFGLVSYENIGSIGKAYRRHDEIGTPFCVTVDFETLGEEENPEAKDTVTLRYRDSLKQERVAIGELAEKIEMLLGGQDE